MRVYVGMPENQARRGTKLAKQLGLSFASYIRMALAERIRADEDKEDQSPPREGGFYGSDSE